MKKILSVILCACLLMCPFAVFAFAEDTAECTHEYTVTVVAPGCATRGYTLHTCGKCGNFYYDNYTDPLGHSYGQWETVKEASCTEEGLMQRVCSRCNGYETKTVSVLDHVDKNSDGKCDKCGAKVKVEKVFSPFDWFKALFKAIREWFAYIFK